MGLLDEAGRFFAEQFAPLNRSGDVQHSQHHADGSVTTPDGFVKAYRRYVEAGWPSVPFPTEYGGGGFPWLVGVAMQELLTSSNMGFSVCPLLTQGAIDMLLHNGGEAQREVYLPKMVDRRVDRDDEPDRAAGRLRRRGARDEGRARPTTGRGGSPGQKIFITYGEHDLADNIVHLVLARVPDAPAGTRGISCFIVPKFLVNDDGSLGARNARRVRLDRAEDGDQRHPDVRDGLRRCRRLPHRRAQPGHAVHVHDDEHRPPLRGHGGPRRRRARLPAGRRVRGRTAAGTGAGGESASRSSSSTPTCAGCCCRCGSTSRRCAASPI